MLQLLKMKLNNFYLDFLFLKYYAYLTQVVQIGMHVSSSKLHDLILLIFQILCENVGKQF